MDFSSVNWLAVALASLAGFVLNFGWFGPLKMYDRWNAALGRTTPPTPEEMMPMPQLFGLTLAGLLVETTVIAALLGGLYPSASVLQGLGVGVAAGAGVAATTSLGHRLFSNQGLRVWLIEIGADVLVAAVIGVVLAAMGS